MAQSWLNSTIVLNEGLAYLHNENNLLANMDRTYDNSFDQYGAAGKPGSTIALRLPNQFTARTGLSMSTQPVQENALQLVVATVVGVDGEWNSLEQCQNINDARKQVIEPAMQVLGTKIETLIGGMYKDVYQAVGTPGTTPGDTGVDAYNTYGAARVLMNQSLCPKKGNQRVAIVPSNHALYAQSAAKSWFNDQKEISKQYLDGSIGRFAGFNWYENELSPSHTNGAQAGTPVVAGSNQLGASLLTSGWTSGTAIKQGTIFTFSTGAKVKMVHPEIKTVFANSHQFTVTADAAADSNGNCALSISPSIVVTGPYQTVSNSPDSGATLTIAGSASTTYSQGLLFHPKAFTAVTAKLETHSDLEMSEARKFENIWLRFEKGTDIQNSRTLWRFDALIGFLTTRPGFACRVWGA